MSDGELGLTESVSIALGGMVGGGIYAVLGVVAGAAGSMAWVSFVVAGGIALCAGYAFVQLNRVTESKGGTVTFIEELVGSPGLAGMAGWTLLTGYVGSMALYAFAFGSHFIDIVGIEEIIGIPLRPVVSVVTIAVFVALVATFPRSRSNTGRGVDSSKGSLRVDSGRNHHLRGCCSGDYEPCPQTR